MGKIRIEFEVDWDDYDDCSTDIIVSNIFEDETRLKKGIKIIGFEKI